jgi:hypothetical protein
VFPENALSLRFHVLSFPWLAYSTNTSLTPARPPKRRIQQIIILAIMITAGCCIAAWLGKLTPDFSRSQKSHGRKISRTSDLSPISRTRLSASRYLWCSVSSHTRWPGYKRPNTNVQWRVRVVELVGSDLHRLGGKYLLAAMLHITWDYSVSCESGNRACSRCLYAKMGPRPIYSYTLPRRAKGK